MPRRRKSVSCPCHCRIAQPRNSGGDIHPRILSHCLAEASPSRRHSRRPAGSRLWGATPPLNRAFQKNRTKKDIFWGRGTPLRVPWFLCGAAPGSPRSLSPAFTGRSSTLLRISGLIDRSGHLGQRQLGRLPLAVRAQPRRKMAHVIQSHSVAPFARGPRVARTASESC